MKIIMIVLDALVNAIMTLVGRRNQKSNLTKEQTRSLAFGAVLATSNEMTFHDLECTKTYVDEAFLEEWWSITDRDSAISTLDWLQTEGHRMTANEDKLGYDEIYRMFLVYGDALRYKEYKLEYEALCNARKILKEKYGYTQEELNSIETVSAWDFDRLVVVARWCYEVGYISEEEAWGYIQAAADKGTADYTSWRGYFAGAIYGEAIWAADDVFDSANTKVANQLLKSKKSIYKQISF